MIFKVKGQGHWVKFLPCDILVNTRINILQWILTKLGTYLVLKRIWNPIDVQGHRSKVKVTVKFLGEGIRHALRCPFIFCFYFQRFKNITQTSSILLFWQTNNTIVYSVYSESNIYLTVPCLPCLVHIYQNCISLLAHNNQNTNCLERNCTLKLTRTVFSLVALLNFDFLFRLISHSNVCQNSSASSACLKT